MDSFHSELFDLQERIRTLNSRFRTVAKYRDRKIKEIEKNQKRIINQVVWLLQDEGYHKDSHQLSVLFYNYGRSLYSDTVSDRASLLYSMQVLLDVINHPRHLPRINALFRQLSNEEQGQFVNQVDSINKMFKIIKDKIEGEIIGNIRKQGEALSKFIREDGIGYFIEYLTLYRSCKHMFEEIYLELRPMVHTLRKGGKLVKQVVKKVHQFDEEHKKAISWLFVAVSLASCAFTMLPTGAIGGGFLVFRKALRVFSRGGGKLMGVHDDVETLVTLSQ
ncbi:hypothetical protein JXB28_00730 [Candidatus Woesearchaeota archaeon]|nr:hypothetical protein [Candidatus Woesearchaeota archaeon]